jgi:hypothetical protein
MSTPDQVDMVEIMYGDQSEACKNFFRYCSSKTDPFGLLAACWGQNKTAIDAARKIAVSKMLECGMNTEEIAAAAQQMNEVVELVSADPDAAMRELRELLPADLPEFQPKERQPFIKFPS